MTRSIYISSAEGHTGKSLVALGVLELLARSEPRVAVFRPITRSLKEDDTVLQALHAHETADVPYDECIGVTYDDVRADPDASLSKIVERYKAVEARADAVVIVGSDYTDVASPAELGFNARIAANLGAPVLLVLTGRAQHGGGEQLGMSESRSPLEMGQIADLALTELDDQRATVLGIVANRTDPDQIEATVDAISASVEAERAARGIKTPIAVWAVPEERNLVAPAVSDVLAAVDGTLLRGDEALLERPVLGVTVAGMSMVNVLPRLHDSWVAVIAADRSEVLLAALLAQSSETFPSVAAIILNGPFEIPEDIMRLIDGLATGVPIITTDMGTYDTTARIMGARGRLTADSQQRYEAARTAFLSNVDADELTAALGVSAPSVVTPLMFEYGLIERARTQRKRIVLPEGTDDRILQAAAIVLARGIADITILGDESATRGRAQDLGLDISAAQIISPFDPEYIAKFAPDYAQIRAHKNVALQQAEETVTDVSYFGTMMVHQGLADGMVSGAQHTTAHTIRPSFEIIKTKPGISAVSSVFFMALADRVLVYGDCAVIPDPSEEQLADIAISSASTAAQFGIEPRVAMLSYSTGESGSGAEVEKVRAATALVQERQPELLVEGPIQYDAAIDASVASTKMPDSKVAGRATVFIFPDLNTGNNTYKAVQRSANAVAIGPVLQGLNKPVNDLSRGALVSDIVNTIAITAIQAQGE